MIQCMQTYTILYLCVLPFCNLHYRQKATGCINQLGLKTTSFFFLSPHFSSSVMWWGWLVWFWMKSLNHWMDNHLVGIWFQHSCPPHVNFLIFNTAIRSRLNFIHVHCSFGLVAGERWVGVAHGSSARVPECSWYRCYLFTLSFLWSSMLDLERHTYVRAKGSQACHPFYL